MRIYYSEFSKRKLKLIINFFLLIIFTYFISCAKKEQKTQGEKQISKAKSKTLITSPLSKYEQLMMRAKALRPDDLFSNVEELVENIKLRAALKKEVDKAYEAGEITAEEREKIIQELRRIGRRE